MEKLNLWPEACEYIWAKSPDQPDGAGESLVAHTWEVLLNLKSLAVLKPWLPELIGYPALWHVLFWAAFFHDWGKIADGFQYSLRVGSTWRHRHEVLSLLFVNWLKDALEGDEELAVVTAIASHHRDADELSELYPIGLVEEDDDAIRDLVQQMKNSDLQTLCKWFSQVAHGWICQLGFDALGVRFPNQLSPGELQAIKACALPAINRAMKAYFQMAKDVKRGKKPEWVRRGIILRGCLILSDHAASAHISEFKGLSVSTSGILSSLGLDPGGIYDHQKQAMHISGSALLIAPTGSGKTEAALLWAANLKDTENIQRLFYTLPYQASMNAMYQRLNSLLPGQVGLLHSRSALALYRSLMKEEGEKAKATRDAKAKVDMARLHCYAVQVFSPYQMLKAAYQIKGYEAALVDYARAAFVMDEIHAYEPRRLAIILEFTSFLREQFGAHFFIMSATMAQVIRERVIEALGQPDTITASSSLFTDFSRHKVHVLDGDIMSEMGLERVNEAFLSGQSVLVTCNTVRRAQEVYNLLREEHDASSVILIHGRFCGRDRLAKEQEIIAATGVKSGARRPVIVVSTQVVEVSLNIDLDVLFSDPAPLEALIQRFGRINRTRRLRYAPVYVFSEPIDSHQVYSPEMMDRAVHILRRIDGLAVDEGQVGSWLDEVYSGDLLKEWNSQYEKAAVEFRTVFLGNLAPFHIDEALEESFDRLFDGTEVLPLALKDEYYSRKASSRLEASELLVPVSYRELSRMKRDGLVVSTMGEWPKVVNVHYSSEFGLEPGARET
ncbi:MAG: CRISPR-associated helicase Cas3' [Bacillota bacterium]